MSEIGKLPSSTSFEMGDSKHVSAGNIESSIEIEPDILRDTSEVEVVIPSEGLVVKRSDSENIVTNAANATTQLYTSLNMGNGHSYIHPLICRPMMTSTTCQTVLMQSPDGILITICCSSKTEALVTGTAALKCFFVNARGLTS